ncbi:glycosyltransferase [Rathayibacter tanaceti]|uniref:D-inositol 3-phosphate glycosyltransferase n=2 Tax=Rathayibacter tanaceti TaxID=1671680 RepID=A0A168GAA0_9MICO|nr:glycosyltransferase [Rathayibacter tanaceti]KZX21955.1 GDP-mannose-dependent alpha-mannosyltransferase [Rathayibacter tanaceti]QHC56047.1 glycosyltransferase [Rathayibacter tanaceti]TCO39100.1 phosphatidylinositol alpha 1,6-mannosyltransferase [Rathayibacter tanaceti]
MRVAVVTESFLPSLNGVTTSVLRVLDEFARRGIKALVVCPAAGAPASYAGHRVVEHPAIAYREFPVGIPTLALTRELADFEPDIVHVASPFLLGARALAAAGRLGVPSVAVYQTDVARFAARYGLRGARALAWRVVRQIHAGADLTLAPSTSALDDLAAAGIERTALWGRGVQSDRFHPRMRSSPTALELRAGLGKGDSLVGYIGRLSPEKRVERLAALAPIAGAELVIGGYGPSSARVGAALGSRARMLGRLDGERLPAAFAALDVFVHTGTEETFGQTVQEAQAAGTAVVAPHAGGPTDLIEHGVDGLLYAPESDSDLRRQVERLVRDPQLRSRLGEAGRRRVLHRTWSALTDELLEHYAVAGARSLAVPRS